MTSLTSSPASPLKGRLRVPGDKSLSHRALLISAMAAGRSTIAGLLEGEDVLHTANALRALGVPVARREEKEGIVWQVDGVGSGGLDEPAGVLDMGNSGTGARLLMGLLATHPLRAILSGDASLSRRPMKRVMDPLRQMGARFRAREDNFLPIEIEGAAIPLPLSHRLAVPSAQVKSAILLAALNAPGVTEIIEPVPSRDHTEIMLRHFGADITVETAPNGERRIRLHGEGEMSPRELVIAGDPSSAAFPVVAALIVPGSQITLPNVGINPLRTGLFETLREMGASLEITNRHEQGGEAVADLVVRASTLNGIRVPSERAPAMIDEYPILAVAAAFARGTTVLQGLGELRIKESDRLQAIAGGLSACGVDVEEQNDGLVIHGRGEQGVTLKKNTVIPSHLDHRIAMAFLICGMAPNSAPITIDDDSMINTSFPGFASLMNGLGAKIAPASNAGKSP